MAIQPTPSQPNLGYGKQTEATIDQANITMRSMPWYQQQMKAWGQDPSNPTLSKSQSEQIRRMAQANGFVVDEGNMEIDNHGNFNPKGHKLRNTLIVAGIAGATLATLGAAGAFSGGGLGIAGGTSGAGATGAGGAGAGLAPLASTTIGTGMIGPIAGGTGLTGAAPIIGGQAVKTSGGSIMSRLLNPDNISDLASTFGARSSGEKANRALKGEFTGVYDRNMLEAQQDRRTNEADAMKKLATTGYITGGGFKAPTYSPLSIGGKTYAPSNLYEPTPISEPEKAGAKALQDQLVNRLGPEGSYTPQPLSSYATPGRAERAGDWLSTGLSTAGTIGKLLGYPKK